MEFKKITRSLSFEMVNGFGLKFWDKLGAEMEISPTDNPKEGYRHMKLLIEEVHKESFPNIESIIVEDTHIDRPQKSMIEEMEACTSFAEIQSFRFTVKNEEEKAVYERKLTELSPKNQ